MEQDKIAKLIKQIRKENKLTQKQFADKYNVTYQAVSKWENGLNLPDKYLLKQISEDFNISMDDIFNGTYAKKNNNKIIIIISSFIVLMLVVIFFIKLNSDKNSNFNFKTLSSSCDKFNISGNIAYNDKKSSIYITNIKYCGGDDTEQYEEIECILYESNNNIDKKISSCIYNDESNITLEEYLKTVTIAVDDYKKSCKEYSENSLYLLLNAKKDNNSTITYKIPLSLDKSCTN